MMGYIQGQAPDTSGKWDIAAVPGGGGNWGGSYLAIPKQSSHPKEAVRADQVPDLARRGGVRLQADGQPAEPAGPAEEPAVQNFRNPFFSNAPVGKIFANRR